jgi:hypothetical protein
VLVLALACAACGPAVTLDAQDDGGTMESESAGATTHADESGGTASSCGSPEVLAQPGPAAMPSGFERCDSGVIHRVAAVTCDFGGVESGGCSDDGDPFAECAFDADCVALGAAYCLPPAEPWAHCECHQPCTSDADCSADQACHCDGPRSRCIPALCRDDSGCADGALCRLAETVTACGAISRRLACTSVLDECLVDADCPMCLQCLPDGDFGEWLCSGSTGICGPCG